MLLTPAGSPGLRAALASAIDQLGGEERIVQEVAEMQTVIGLVAAGVGISLVPESVRALVRHGVTYRPLAATHLPCGWRWPGAQPTSRRCSPRSWRRRARRPPPKEREVDGGLRAIDVAATPGRREMFRGRCEVGSHQVVEDQTTKAGG